MDNSRRPESKDAFISYASQDRDRVIAIAKALESAGVSVWRDEMQILGGDCYGPAIVHAIQHSKVLVPLQV